MSLIQWGLFESHSGVRLPWKINCDELTDEDIEAIANIIRRKFFFGSVYGVPRGGTRLAEALKPHVVDRYPLLIVDDVLTTGNSMNKARDMLFNPEAAPADIADPFGVVIFARAPCPNWVWPIFSVSKWTQPKGGV